MTYSVQKKKKSLQPYGGNCSSTFIADHIKTNCFFCRVISKPFIVEAFECFIISHCVILHANLQNNVLCWTGCAVLIVETMLDGHRPYSTLQSLNMLAQTEGLERTENQYADLLSQHGFGDTRAVHTRNFLDAFIAIKM